MRSRVAGAIIAALVLAGAVALAAGFPAVLRIPPKNSSAARSVPAASFSHRSHQTFGCYACHPSVFPQAPLGFSHEEMRQGRFCATCHEGAAAFAVESAPCQRCHVK